MENQTLAFAERTLRDHLALLPEGWGRNFEIATGLSGGGDYSYCVRDGKARFTGSTPGNVLLGVYDYLRAIGFVFLYPGKGGQLVRSAGVMAQLMAKENGYALVRLPSGEMRTGASALKERIAWRKLWILSIGCRKTASTPSFCSSKSRIFSLSAGICTPTIQACRRKR